MGATRHRDAAGTAARPAAPPVAEPGIAPPPVFVDSTGRRRRLVRRVAFGLLIGACAYGVLVIVSILGGPVPPNALLPLPGGQHGPISAGNVSATAHPAATTAATRAGTGSTGAVPGPGSTTAAARAAASPKAAPSAALSPSPAATRHQPPGLVGKSASPGATGHGH